MAAYLSAFTINGGVPLITRKFGNLKSVKMTFSIYSLNAETSFLTF